MWIMAETSSMLQYTYEYLRILKEYLKNPKTSKS